MAENYDRYPVSSSKALTNVDGSIGPEKTSKVDAQQLNTIQHRAQRLDKWGLFIGLVPHR
ncbi:hypothetical protein PENANT_c056G01879 [Penicillium antarcticum]|uniref:Uncharacterized protein n=1 Tax=Penicillium antarcticum TaxID=416450 RepID=A0A1V6PQJ4_9EURO|nr:uncharacterized protein N7508_011138 [Penicillium antarcticum]XP_058314209.1 uncharacterized protein N7508_011171 [Penicillium antarcticum]KAJ5288363.1 hypothetical protein N7508_011138 [Penicillium antarcticum]KAJ5288396.1 hypothetical protein N7508_011171 [Penicillium antarcticum]OQD79255.1 hypothetical protein PENANT_c056G01879 [Penicillium antarcticum]